MTQEKDKVKIVVDQNGYGYLYLYGSRSHCIKVEGKVTTQSKSDWQLSKTFGPSNIQDMQDQFEKIVKLQGNI